jgi:RNA polymerase sigma-70 factor (TIGR02960 family)
MPATDQTVSAAVAGDEPAFAALTERHRRELHVHCYRMLASFDEAEDAVQETFLKAWCGRSGFEGGPQFRAWLYRIATNVCLDMLRRGSRRTAGNSPPEVPWLQPYPDLLLEAAAPSDEQPEAVVIQRETISLAFLAALQALPPRQRAALIARDVLGWPASQTASALGTSVAAANSALQRARATMQSHLPARRAEWSAGDPSAEERELVEQFIAAHERFDADAVMAIAAKDIRVTMPPLPYCFDGPEAISPLMANAAAMGEWRLVPVGANRMPAAASYLRRPGDSEFRAFKLDVMRVEAGAIAEITTFNAQLFPAFGLRPTLLEPVSFRLAAHAAPDRRRGLGLDLAVRPPLRRHDEARFEQLGTVEEPGDLGLGPQRHRRRQQRVHSFVHLGVALPAEVLGGV